jgi:hypothetical protein
MKHPSVPHVNATFRATLIIRLNHPDTVKNSNANCSFPSERDANDVDV